MLNHFEIENDSLFKRKKLIWALTQGQSFDKNINSKNFYFDYSFNHSLALYLYKFNKLKNLIFCKTTYLKRV